MIGLVRRPDRRNRMIACLEELNFDYTLFDAVDGRCGLHALNHTPSSECQNVQN